MKEVVTGRHLLKPSDFPLIEFTNIFVSNSIWLQKGFENDVATFDLVVREIHNDWGFYIFNGLERCLDIINNFTFDEEAIMLLKKMQLIKDSKTEEYYRNLTFTGNVHTLREGTIFFPGEPIVRITAPLIEANLLTALILNVFCYPIRILTKSTRVTLATRGSNSVASGAGVVRVPDFSCAVDSSKSVFLNGGRANTPILFRKYPELFEENPYTAANINHALVKSFPTEDEAFEYSIKTLSKQIDTLWIMADTYDFKKGVQKIINLLNREPEIDQTKMFISIDSGDLYEQAMYARNLLDKNGLEKVRIQAFSNLDEYKIFDFVEKKTPIDLYIASTEVLNITDAPKLEVVYKMAKLIKPDGTIEQKAKLATGKVSYPEDKQIFRKYDDKGMFLKDIIGVDDEKLGEPLLKPYIVDGKQIAFVDSPKDIKPFFEKQLASMSEDILKIRNPRRVVPEFSEKLQESLNKIKEVHNN